MRDDAGNMEIELKLRMTDLQLARLRRADWWRDLPDAASSELESVYVDTANSDLHRLGLALRMRTKDEGFEQTLKMISAGDPFRRREWTAPFTGSAPDPTCFCDPALPEEFRALAASDLTPVFRLAVHRETRRSRDDGADIEIAVDEGWVEAGDLKTPITEIELELKSGKATALIGAARRILDIAGGRAFLRSKADRGYDLAERRDAFWTKPGKFPLDRDMSVAQALQAIVLRAAHHLMSNDDCARINAHVEGVHQCRIACRQVRSAFRLFRRVAPDAPFAALRDEAKRIAGALGRARDIDVMRTELLEPARAALDSPELIDRLLAELAKERAKAYARVASTLADQRYERFLIDLLDVATSDQWAESGDRRALDRHATRFAEAALDKAYDRVRKSGRGFKDLSAADRHKLRIDVKRMRDASDFFASLFDAEETKRFRKQLADLQDRLGALNDLVVAKYSLTALADRAAGPDEGLAANLSAVADRILEWRAKDAGKLNDALIDDWKAFEDARPFWRGE